MRGTVALEREFFGSPTRPRHTERSTVGIALVFVPLTIFAIGLSSRRTETGVSAEVLLAFQDVIASIG
jgi:hypothetical protein